MSNHASGFVNKYGKQAYKNWGIGNMQDYKASKELQLVTLGDGTLAVVVEGTDINQSHNCLAHGHTNEAACWESVARDLFRKISKFNKKITEAMRGLDSSDSPNE